MAKQFGGAFANYYGKVGNVVARIRQGRTILSIYQPNVHNPRTDAQVAQRTDFGLITKFLSPLAQILKYGFHNLDGYKTGNYFSAAVGFNLKHNVLSGEGDNREVDSSKTYIAEGKIALPYSPSATADGTTLSLTWADNSGMGDAQADDKVMVAALNGMKGQAVTNVEVATRADRNCTLTLPSAWTGDNVDVWMVMRRGEYDCSNSTHLATLPL
jgi:hypothetical protein